jgi:4-hydroxy-tetrahydrodipicolinate reductase
MDKLKIIQGYTGEIARHQIRVIHDCPTMELVGAYVHHEEKNGVDAGEIAGIGPIGVRATTDLEEILALDADCVLYNPPLERYDEIIRLLASGKNVISIIAGWNPKQLRCYPDILKACEEGQSSLFGTGLNPGLSYELALLASSVCCEVESIRISTCEPQESLSEVFLEFFGFGKTEEELESRKHNAYDIFRNLLQITDLLCDELSLPRDGREFDVEFEPATQDYSDKVVVAKGTMAGLLVKAATTWQGKPIATFELRFLLGPEYVREEWLDGRPAHGWIEVDVRGTPGSRIFHEVYMDEDIIGTWSTGTKAINSIAAVVAAGPGLLSPTDLPLGKMQKLRS